MREHGARGLEDEVLHACLHSLVYDTQSEGTRGGWLHEIVVAAGLTEAVLPRVIEALRESREEHSWDTSQLYSLACAFAEDGHEDAREAVYEVHDKQYDHGPVCEPWLSGLPIVEMDGVAGLLHVVNILGRCLSDKQNRWEKVFLYDEACELLGKEVVERTLLEEAAKSEDARAFLESVQKEQKEWADRKKEPPAPLESVEDVLNKIEQPQDIAKGWPRRWGRRADDKDVQTIFEHMLKEDRPEYLERYLRIFSRRPMPRLDRKFLELARTGPQGAREACIDALSQITDEQVHSLAAELLGQESPFVEAISLLRSNYRPEDAKMLESAVVHASGDDSIHGVVLDIVNITQDRAAPELINIFLWAYENSPCSMCRESVVNRMTGLEIAPRKLLMECLADSYGDTRKLARLALAGERAED